MSIRNKLLDIALMLGQRGVGNTSVQQEGINNYRGDVAVLAHDDRMARDFVHYRKQIRDMYRTVELTPSRNMVGLRMPLVIDHHCLKLLLAEAVAEIDKLAQGGNMARSTYVYVVRDMSSFGADVVGTFTVKHEAQAFVKPLLEDHMMDLRVIRFVDGRRPGSQPKWWSTSAELEEFVSS